MSDEHRQKPTLSDDFEVFVKIRDGFVIDPEGLDIFVPADIFFPKSDPDGIGFDISPYAVYQKTGERVTDSVLLKRIFSKIREIADRKGIPLEFR